MSWLDGSTLRNQRLLVLIGALILFSRFPNGVLHAELWGDEGWTFYPQAYEIGLRSLLIPVNGYLNTAQRLGAVFAVFAHVPLTRVPTLFALIALGTQLIVAGYMTSSRIDLLWPNRLGRVVAAFMYLSLPNSVETFGNLTNIQWHLSLLAFMIILSSPASGRMQRYLEIFALLICGLSGPFCILLGPFATLKVWKSRHDPSARLSAIINAGIVLGCALTQVGVLLFDNTIRHAGGLDSLTVLARIISLQVVLGLLLGVNTTSQIAGAHFWQLNVYPWLIAATACAFCVAGFIRGGFLLRAFCVYCGLVFLSELASPVVAPGASPWHQLLTPWACQRYFFIPMLGLASIIISFAGQATEIERYLGYAGLVLVGLWGIPHDWSYPELGPTDFVPRARAFETAPAGTRAAFPIHPHDVRPMILIKRAH